MAERTRDGEEVVKAAFGASLYEQGRGYYVTLELFALIWGTAARVDKQILPPLDGEPELSVVRRSHDFARRLVANMLSPEKAADAFESAQSSSLETVRALLQGLTVATAGRRAPAKNWGATHFYPYVGDLIHYDAVDRRGKPSMERYLFRGGGGLAHRLLRSDPEVLRLDATRRGFARLVGESTGALGSLAAALAAHDEAEPKEFKDGLEPGAEQPLDLRRGVACAWAELLRSGVANILGRDRLHQAKKVEALMHWVPYCIARHQLERSAAILGRAVPVLPIDLQARSSSVRDASRSALDTSRGMVFSALERKAVELGKGNLLAQRQQTWREGSRGFFTGTLATIGALNALSGKRHFCFRVGMLESMTLAVLRPDEEVPVQEFCRALFERLGVAVDADAAAQTQELADVNRSDFADNEAALRYALRSLGMLREYSDATRMVGALA
jgi:hypothetical protein